MSIPQATRSNIIQLQPRKPAQHQVQPAATTMTVTFTAEQIEYLESISMGMPLELIVQELPTILHKLSTEGAFKTTITQEQPQ